MRMGVKTSQILKILERYVDYTGLYVDYIGRYVDYIGRLAIGNRNSLNSHFGSNLNSVKACLLQNCRSSSPPGSFPFLGNLTCIWVTPIRYYVFPMQGTGSHQLSQTVSALDGNCDIGKTGQLCYIGYDAGIPQGSSSGPIWGQQQHMVWVVFSSL